MECLTLPLNIYLTTPWLFYSTPIASLAIYHPTYPLLPKGFPLYTFQPTMLNTKRIIEMERKSQKVASSGRRRIMSMRTDGGGNSEACSMSVASRGHIFVYSNDGERFMIPIGYLTSNIFRELFRMSEEEFGLPSDRPITLPCDAKFMEYIISLLRYRVSTDVERAVLTSIANGRCTASLPPHGHNHHQLILYGF